MGDLPEGMTIAGYRGSVGPQGGTMLWNFDLSAHAEGLLRARCTSPGYLRPLDGHLSVASPNWTAEQPKGCLIAGRALAERTYSEVVLQDHVLQLLVAL